MHPDIEKIIKELHAIDPTLLERGGDIRALVTSLLESKPEVAIDQNFILNLRKSVLNRASVHTPKSVQAHPSRALLWWATRLAPIGAVALLFFILYPTSHTLPPAQTLPLNTTPQGNTTNYVQPYQAPTNSTRMETFRTSAPVHDSTATDSALGSPTMMQKSAPANTSVIALDSVTLLQPGFVVIHVTTQGNFGEVLGVSPLLPVGTTSGVFISFTRPPAPGESITTVLYIDNGDGRYTNDDTYSIVLP